MKNEDKDLVKLAGAGGLLAAVGTGSKLNKEAAKYYIRKGRSNSEKFAGGRLKPYLVSLKILQIDRRLQLLRESMAKDLFTW